MMLNKEILKNSRKEEGEVEEAYTVPNLHLRDDRSNTQLHIKLKDHDIIYSLSSHSSGFRVDKGERVRIYTGGDSIGYKLAQNTIRVLEILDDRGNAKFTYAFSHHDLTKQSSDKVQKHPE
jgi:hypothetical protein